MSSSTEDDSAPPGKSSLLVAAGILASRVAGVVRQAVVAGFLGAGPVVDAFTAAFRIPNALQNLLGEGVLSASFIPVYARLLAEGRREEAGRVAGAVAGLLAAVVGVLALLGIVLAGPLTSVLAPGFTGAQRELTVTFVRILFPGIGLLVLSAWCLGVLNSHRRFFLSYVAPVVWNVAQIVALTAVALVAYRGATVSGVSQAARGMGTALAWGATIGGGLQLAVQLPTVWRVTGGVRLSLDRGGPVGAVLRAFAPVVGARGVVQLSALLDLVLASFLASGAVSVLGYAQVLYLLPISLFAMSVAAAELPELARIGADHGAMGARVTSGQGRVAFLVVPTAAAYLGVGYVVVGALYQRGAFGSAQTAQVWATLGAYAVGLVATCASRLYQSALYAAGHPTVPARASLARVAVSAVLGVALMLQLDRVGVTAAGLAVVGDLPAFAPVEGGLRVASDVPRLGAAGLAFGAGVAAWVEMAVLRRAATRTLGPTPAGGTHLAELVGAAGGAVVAAVVVSQLASGVGTIGRAVLVAAVAVPAYLGLTVVLRVPEAAALLQRLRSSGPRGRPPYTRRR